MAAKESGVEGEAASLSLKDKEAEDIEKRLPGGKVKKKAKPEVILEVSTRSKKKSVTTIQGRPLFRQGPGQLLCPHMAARPVHRTCASSEGSFGGLRQEYHYIPANQVIFCLCIQ